MPFNRCNLGNEQGLIDDPVLGQGRDPLAPLQDVINDEDDIVMPVDPRYLGLWLTGLFGDPDTSDNLDGSRDHECASGGEDLPSYTLQLRLPGRRERRLRPHADGDAHQRARRSGLCMVLPRRSAVGYTKLIHRSLLKVIPGSVDERAGRVTIAISLGETAEEREPVRAEGERRTPQSARRGRSSWSSGSPPSPTAARAGPATARRNRAGAARRRIPADPAPCRAPRTAG